MNKSDSIGALATAMSKAQGQIKDAVKDQKGDRAKYANLGQILNIIRPVFSSHGLSVVQFPCECEAGSVAVETVLMHESGEYISNHFSMPIHRIVTKDGRDVTNSAQASGSIITYARRYALAAVAGITQEDNDAALNREEKKNTDMHSEKSTAMAKALELEMSHCKSLEELQSVFKRAYEWARENNETKHGGTLTKIYNDQKTLSGWK